MMDVDGVYVTKDEESKRVAFQNLKILIYSILYIQVFKNMNLEMRKDIMWMMKF